MIDIYDAIATMEKLFPGTHQGREWTLMQPWGDEGAAGPVEFAAWTLDTDAPTLDELETAAHLHGTRGQAQRMERASRLVDADHAVNRAEDLGDVEAIKRARAYRQALRDITLQAGFPDRIKWPTKPEKE